MKTCKSRVVVVGVGLLLMSAGCVDGEVGTDDCVGDGVQCRLPEQSSITWPQQEELSTRDVSEISATWIRALPVPDNSDEWKVALTSDLKGGVWLFATEKAGVEAMRLDAEGGVAERTTIAPPRELHVTNADRSQVYAPQQGAVGPTISVSWFLGDLAEPRTEWIRFGAHIDDALQRFAPQANQVDQIVWAADGSRYALREWVLEKYDRKDRLEWRQAALGNALDVDTQRWSFGLTLDERVVAFAWERDYVAAYLVSADGNIDRHAGAPAMVLAGPDPTRTSPAAALVVPDEMGDLHMWRVESAETEYVRFAGAVVHRADFHLLSPAASAMDSQGTLYALTRTGGRDPADQRYMLCRVPVDGAASCVKLAPTGPLAVTEREPVGQLAIDADGVVFLRLGTELARIDLPEP